MASIVKSVVRLQSDERGQLRDLVGKGKRAAAVLTRARILLKADVGPQGPALDDESIVEAVETSLSTVHRVRQELVEEGLEAALYRKSPTGRQFRKLDGEQEAKRIAVACSQAPEGRCRWTLQLLADKLVERNVVDSVSAECVRTTLKKTNLSPGSRSSG